MKSAILETLEYFSQFSHPLEAEEVRKFLRQRAEPEEVLQALTLLRLDGKVSESHGFWCLSGQEDTLAERRKHLDLNRTFLERAQTMARRISKFPFVRTVCISGSLSKGGLKPGGDIDFFIITGTGRVWFTKTCLALYKKIVLKGKKDHFCINYLLDEQALRIKRHNIYQATELATAWPLTGPEHYEQLLSSNNWLRTYFPNFRPYEEPEKVVPGRWKKFAESLFSGWPGELFETLCMRVYSWHIERKYLNDWQTRRESKFEVSRHTSAFFPVNYERKVLDNQRPQPAFSSLSA